jgi:hypothetical protein
VNWVGNEWSLANLQQLRDIYSAWFTSSMVAITPTNTNLFRIKTTYLYQTTSPRDDSLVIPVKTGTFNTPVMPNNIAAVIKWTSASYGAAYRGRTYHAPIPITYVTGNNLNSSGQSYYQTAYAALKTAFTFSSHFPVIVSWAIGGAWRASGLVTAITGVNCEFALGTQRMRMPVRV